MQQHVPAAVLSRVSAYDWLGSVALVPLGYPLAGPLAGAIGVTTTLWLAAGWTVAGSAVALAVPSVRQLRPAAGKAPDAADRISPKSCLLNSGTAAR